MFYIKKFYTALDFIVLQKHNNNLAGHSCGIIQTPQHINLASLRGVENRRGLDRAKGHLIVHKCETQSLIIILYGWKSYSHRISLLAITLENNLQSWLRSDIGQQFLRSVLSPFLKNKTTMLLLHACEVLPSWRTKLKMRCSCLRTGDPPALKNSVSEDSTIGGRQCGNSPGKQTNKYRLRWFSVEPLTRSQRLCNMNLYDDGPNTSINYNIYNNNFVDYFIYIFLYISTVELHAMCKFLVHATQINIFFSRNQIFNYPGLVILHIFIQINVFMS